MYRLFVRGEGIAKVSREQNQAMLSKRTRDTSNTAALEQIYPQTRGRVGSPEGSAFPTSR